MDQTILEVQDLRIHFELREGTVKALNGIDLVLKEGRTLGLVGETGAGKTTLAKGIMGLTAKPYGKICWRWTKSSFAESAESISL